MWKLEELRVIRSSLSVATMISLFVLIFIIIFSKASLLIVKPIIALEIIGYQTLIVFGLIALSLAVDKVLRIKYEDHQSIILTSITKNESVAVAMATMALSPAASVVPAIILLIQPVLSISYIHLEKEVKKLLGTANS
ncbi:hypothetical protein IOK49_02345 [Fervidicoccus fontis]|uniref:Arsenic resistance protein n=1 Tax=Fervidicoccus fontis TaxID=683846 RepID=A0A843AHG1_9CREN|nr:hypothetical protein [Fervidicoccus fontis]MBE9390920.1 hypothetical protein [Fervidicoccus fontis]